ncbi:4Fe-4S binding protein [Anaerobacillus sp. MEB173]|uniref:4Fe-4S binding protein n=1 Tax=Anaerobacillus sp. MEB173 TaxID=3383345 RepID=UPI003F8F5537
MAKPERKLVPPQLDPKPKNDLLKVPIIKKFIQSRWYPGIFQWMGMVVFSVIVFQLVLGTVDPHNNFGISMTWVLWWPIIPIIFIALGRFWCAVCPFGKTSDIVRRLVGKERPMPKFLKKYGIWLIDIFFILITWGDHIWGVVESPRGSGYLLLGLFTMVVITSVFYERRTFCKTLCFLGGLAGNYSRAGMLELRGTPDICRTCKTQDCYKGNEKAEGCNMFQFVRTMNTSADCNLCGNCVKTCPNDSIRLSVRKPTSELWLLQNPKLEHAFLATVIMGIVFVQNMTMLEFWEGILNGIGTLTRTTYYPVNFTIAFLIAMIIPIFLMWLTAKITVAVDSTTTVKNNFIRYGYAIIPLDLAGHIGHNLFHLITEGKAVWFNTVALFGVQMTGDLGFASDETVRIWQFVMIGLGAIGSLYAVYRIGDRKPIKKLWPFYLIMIIFTVINIVLFSLPMDHRVH